MMKNNLSIAKMVKPSGSRKWIHKHARRWGVFIGASTVLLTFLLKDGICDRLKEERESLQQATDSAEIRLMIIDQARAIKESKARIEDVEATLNGESKKDNKGYITEEWWVGISQHESVAYFRSVENLAFLADRIPDCPPSIKEQIDQIKQVAKEIETNEENSNRESIDRNKQFQDSLRKATNQLEKVLANREYDKNCQAAINRSYTMVTQRIYSQGLVNRLHEQLIFVAISDMKRIECDLNRWTYASWGLYLFGVVIATAGKLKDVEIPEVE